MGQEQSRNTGRLGNKEDQKNNYEKTGSVPLTTPESYLNRQSLSCHDDVTVQNRATPESHLKARFSCNEDITVQNRAGSGSSNNVYNISNANPSNVSDMPLTFTKFETTASKSSIQTTTSSPKSSEHKKNPKMDISYLDIKESDMSSGCIKKENPEIAIGVSNQYNEGKLDSLSSLPKIADINNTEFVDLVRDIRHVSSKMDDKSNINVSPERQFASLTLNTDVRRRTLNEKDDFVASRTFTNSRSNIADPLTDNLKYQTDHSVGNSFLTPSMSEISQKNKIFPKSTPSYFDTSPLIPVKTPVKSVCSLETNKGNVLGNNIENNSNQPTHTMGYKNSEPLTYVQREINTNLQEIKIKKNLPKTGIKKHNITRKSGNLTTLTHIEKLAENIYSLSSPKSEKSKLPPNKCLNKANMYEQKTCLINSNLNITSSLQECIYEMTNFDVKDIDTLFSLQQSLLTNLKTVNSFISVLKTCPILNEDLINEICLLRDNMLSFSADKLTQNMHEHSAPDSERTSISLSNQSIDTGDLRQFANSMDLVQLTESVGNVETNNEKTTVEFVRDEARSYSFENLSHVNSQDHQKFVSEIESLGNTQKQASLSNTINTTEKLHLPPNYEEVLTIVYKLLEKGSELDISVYICRFCDLSTNTEEDANCHLSDENHIKNQCDEAKWHNCKSCCLNIFGTNDHLKEHNSTVQHNAIVNLKTIQSDKFLSGDNPQAADKFDSASVCSSTSNLSNKGVKSKLQPHEILLTIAKDKLNKTSESAVGLYCQICNRYNIYPSEDHFKTEIHKNKLTMAKGHNGCSIFFCNTCKVDLFVDKKTLKEHNRMPLHLELSSLKGKRNSDNTESNESEEDDASELPTLSNEEGPHFDLMKAVIKIHLTNDSVNKSTFLGYYCHLCEAYFLDENIWKLHKNSEYHGKRINSTEYVGKQLYHECKVCNIIIIGSEHVFSVHKKSLVHQAIDRKQQKANPSRVIEGNINKPASEDELSDEDTDDDSGDDNSTVDGSDSLSTTSSNKINAKRNKININGIHVTGLPNGIEQKVVFECFKCFGYIKKCTFNKKRCSSTIIYRKCEDAQKVLRIKQVMVRNKMTSVRPLIVGKKSRSKKKPVELKVEVREVLISRNSIEGLMTVLQSKMLHDKKEGDYKNQLIERDISAAVRGCKVHFFGSRVTGLATSESDLDVYIDFDNRSFFTDLSHDEQIQRLRSLLERFAHPKSAFQVKEYIFDARVPIIRVIHTKTGTPCDISCRSGLSVENSQLVKMFIEADKRVRWLVVIVKWWMRSNDLLGCNIFTSYASTWLVIFFLMRYKFLCSIVDLQKGCPKYSIAHWDCRFSRKLQTYVKTENNVTGFELLNQFFLFYKNFNFDFIVLCPLSAGVIPRKQFETLQLPVAFSPYVDKMNQNPRGEPLRVNTPICLQDPFDLSHNITKGVSRKDLKKFKALCDQSARLCQGLKN